MRLKWLAWLVVLAGCPDIPTETSVGAEPYIEFDPTNAIIPFPNNLLLDPLTGKISIPPQTCESGAQAAVRTGVLNTLDGFGTFEIGLQATATAAIDPTTLTSNVLLYKRLDGQNPVATATAMPVPIMVTPSQTLRFDPNDCADPATIAALTIAPQVPLDPNSTYTVAILQGVMTASSASFYPSFLWSLVRQSENPVTVATGCTPTPTSSCAIVDDRTPIAADNDADVAQLNGIAYLWDAHGPGLAFLDALGKTEPNRSNLLLAWEFTTMTTTAPLDPSVANSPASATSTSPLIGTYSVAANLTTECRTTGAGVMSCACGLDANGGANAADGCTNFFNQVALGAGACTLLPCAAVGDILGAGLIANGYQTMLANSANPNAPIPGPWMDPVKPMQTGAETLQVLAFLPNATVVPGGMPAGGWPVVVFGHGLGGSKEELFAVASQLASAGFASVAIDLQDSGSRAVATSQDPNLGCAGTCKIATGACSAIAPCAAGDTCVGAVGAISPTTTQQCYASILTTDLATTRDNIRQTVLDLQRLVGAIEGCGSGGTQHCSYSTAGDTGTFAVDPTHIVYTGISLGGIIGSTTSAVEQHFQSAVLNVSAMGLLDILENTSTLAIRCPLVNALIMNGVLTGQLWSPAMPTMGLCTTNAWTMQAGYQQFSQAARWVLNPADGANFALPHTGFAGLASKRMFLMEVVNDQVVPNLATNDEGMLLGLTAQTADPLPVGGSTPSAALTMPNLTSNHWIQYPFVPPTSMAAPGNAFQHASLLEPVGGFCSVTTTTSCTMTTQCPNSEFCDTTAGVLGTERVQIDAITFLHANH